MRTHFATFDNVLSKFSKIKNAYISPKCHNLTFCSHFILLEKELEDALYVRKHRGSGVIIGMAGVTRLNYFFVEARASNRPPKVILASSISYPFFRPMRSNNAPSLAMVTSQPNWVT